MYMLSLWKNYVCKIGFHCIGNIVDKKFDLLGEITGRFNVSYTRLRVCIDDYSILGESNYACGQPLILYHK